tara:strand:- start:3409 stop:3597 length:189 start_codon:yes stop_codon:yes gene_type:complete
MKKFSYIATAVSILHFFEDAALIALGRYTEIHYWVLLIVTILFGLLIATIAREGHVKRWLGS